MTTTTRWPQWVQEPLLHFLILGALIFALDWVMSERKDDPKLIVVGPEVTQEATHIFKGSIGRDPTPAELSVLRLRWIDNEVLYREGLALRVEQGDSAIRERVIFKALNVMQANLSPPKIDEPGLRDWFEANRAAYDEPPRFDFLEAVLIGDGSPDKVTAFVDALNQGVQKDEQSGLRVFKGRPRNSLVVSYGEDFIAALEQLPPGQWRALTSKDGLHVVRLEGKTAGVATTYEAVQARVYPDWKDQTLQRMRTAAVRELGKKYKIKHTEAKP